MRRTGVRLRSDGQKRESILDGAAECFTERGYAATAIDDIADRIGSTKGLIYYHFRSKADIFFEVYRKAVSRAIDRARPLAAGPGSGAERLHRMGRAHLHGIIDNFAYHQVSKQGIESHLVTALTSEQQWDLRDLVDLRDAYESLYTGVICDGLNDRTLVAANPSIASKTFLGALNGMSVWYRPRPDDTAEDHHLLVEQVLRLVLGGFLMR